MAIRCDRQTDTHTITQTHNNHRLRIPILRILKILKIHEFLRILKMPTNFKQKHKIRSVSLRIIYELYHADAQKTQVRLHHPYLTKVVLKSPLKCMEI